MSLREKIIEKAKTLCDIEDAWSVALKEDREKIVKQKWVSVDVLLGLLDQKIEEIKKFGWYRAEPASEYPHNVDVLTIKQLTDLVDEVLGGKTEAKP